MGEGVVVIICFVFLGWTNRWKELGQPWSHRVSAGVLGGWAKSALLGRGPTSRLLCVSSEGSASGCIL